MWCARPSAIAASPCRSAWSRCSCRARPGAAPSSRSLRQGDAVRLGFHARGSDVIVDQHVCPILVPALGDLMAPLRAVLRQVLRDGDAADILATETLTGFDLLITCDATPNAGQRAALAGFAAEHTSRASAGNRGAARRSRSC